MLVLIFVCSGQEQISAPNYGENFLLIFHYSFLWLPLASGNFKDLNGAIRALNFISENLTVKLVDVLVWKDVDVNKKN